MNDAPRHLLALVVWPAALLFLAWGGLPARWRRATALIASLIGLVFLLIALNSEGLRETNPTAVYLVGTAYRTGRVLASASLPYYVLTGVCLALGVLGLALTDHAAQQLQRRYVGWAILFSVSVAVLRLLLETAAAPPALTVPFGVTWLAPVVGAFFWLRSRQEETSLRTLAGRLYGYGLAVRGFVAFLYVLATNLRLGTHYDLTALTKVRAPWGAVYHFQPGSFEQLLDLVLIPQLLIWPVYTLVAGLIGALVAAAIVSATGRRPAPAPAPMPRPDHP